MQSLPMGTMKVHQFARGLITWDHHDPPSLSLACNKRLRPLAPKLPATPADSLAKDTSLHAKTPAIAETDFRRRVETQPGGTRWNPTQEQIGILEMLYRGGVRTPNAQQIEQITVQLSKYGKIEGKNVFYWFQNHKARERQKQKRSSFTHIISPRTSSSSSLTTITLGDGDHEKVEIKEEEHSPYKRKSRSWGFEWLEVEESRWSCKDEEDEGDRTLELFPLHPESR